MANGYQQPIPFHLFASDKNNLAPGVVLLVLLASLKDVANLPEVVKWQLNAYTNWNLLLCLLGRALGQRQWEPFLCCSSMGVLVGFRTGFCQGLLENLRKKFKEKGQDMSRPLFYLLDHVVHTVPPVYFVHKLVHEKRPIHYMNTFYSLILATWYAFRQQAQLDSSSVYVPHPWRRAWGGIFMGIFATPRLVEALIAKDGKRTLLTLMALCLPWCTTRFDPKLKQKYMFEYAVSWMAKPKAKNTGESLGWRPLHPIRDAEGHDGNRIPRVQSELLPPGRIH